VKIINRTTRGAERDNAQMSLMDHLRELRGRVVKSVAAIIVGLVVCYFLYEQIYTFMIRPYCESVESIDEKCQLYYTDLLGGFVLRMKVAMWGGIIVALPVILWQLWRFIVPGLYKNERKYTIAFVATSLLLFALGAALAYYTLPTMLEWLRGASSPDPSLVPLQTVDRYFWLTAMMMVGFGIGFEFPVLLVALQLVGVLTPTMLASWRRYAAVGIVLLVAVITPGGDPISLVMLSVPMYVFYELSILIGWLVLRRRRKADEPAATASG
jgi:sec-independent protein translocase protein TatC